MIFFLSLLKNFLSQLPDYKVGVQRAFCNLSKIIPSETMLLYISKSYGLSLIFTYSICEKTLPMIVSKTCASPNRLVYVSLELDFCESTLLRKWGAVLSIWESLFDNIFFQISQERVLELHSWIDLFPQASFYFENFYWLGRLKIKNKFLYIPENFVPSLFLQNSSCKVARSLFSPFLSSCTYMQLGPTSWHFNILWRSL